jgi:hypothetical protein
MVGKFPLILHTTMNYNLAYVHKLKPAGKMMVESDI